MNNVIIISEVTHTGEVHYQVNSCFVEMISGLYPNQKVIFIAESKHSIVVQNCFQNKEHHNLNFLPFEGYYDEKKFNWSRKIIGEFIQIIKILRLGRLHKNDMYIWTCLFPTGHFFLNFITFFQKRTKHVIILHGELEFLNNKGKRKSELFLGMVLKFAMYLSSKKTKYIVLGDNIKRSLTDLVSERILKRIYSILHPYNYFIDEHLSNLSNIEKLKIGAIGTQMFSKNSNYIYSLAECFKEDIIQKKIKFLTIGKVLPELNYLETELVTKLHSDSFVSQKEFEYEISKLNFIIFFYDNSAYKLCASGAIFEAIRLNIPVIALKNDYFEWLFESYGDMGFLCDTLEDIKVLINELKIDRHKENIEKFKKNIENFKGYNNLKNLALNLERII